MTVWATALPNACRSRPIRAHSRHPIGPEADAPSRRSAPPDPPIGDIVPWSSSFETGTRSVRRTIRRIRSVDTRIRNNRRIKPRFSG